MKNGFVGCMLVCCENSTHEQQSKQSTKMRKFSNGTQKFSFEEELEKKITTPLEGKTDALKMKDLTKRLPFAVFHVTDPTKGLYYQVEIEDAAMFDSPVIYYYDDYGKSYPCGGFPRPFKIEVTTGTAHAIKKDVTHLFG